jgi:uncharacterized protein DUF4386
VGPGRCHGDRGQHCQHTTLFRVGFLTDLLDFTCFLAAGLLLYALFKSVDATVAAAMLTLNAVSVAMQALNMLNHLAALLVATDQAYTAGLLPESSRALVLLFIDLHHRATSSPRSSSDCSCCRSAISSTARAASPNHLARS